MPYVLAVGKIAEEGLALLRARPDIRLAAIAEGDPARVLEAIPGADALLVRTMRITPAMLDLAPGLKVVSRHGVGYDNLDVDDLTRRRIPLAVTATANRVAVAEHAFWMMIELAKRGREHDDAVREGRWSHRNAYRSTELWRKTLLLMGFGRIGHDLAIRARAFGMTIEVHDPFVDADRIEAVGFTKVADLREALGRADFVSLHLPRTPETENIVDARALAAMKPGAILVNTARGGLVDEAALAAALRSGHLRAAGIDVFGTEPPAADNPLLGLANVLLTPHNAGISAEAAGRIAVEAAVNVLAALDGRLPREMVINPEILGSPIEVPA